MKADSESKQLATRYITLCDLIGESVCDGHANGGEVVKAVKTLADKDTSFYAMSLAIQKYGDNQEMAAMVAGVIIGVEHPTPISLDDAEANVRGSS